MKVNVNELESIKDKIHFNLENFDELILNYYFELDTISKNWKDGNSLSFFEAVLLGKKNVKFNYNFFKKIENVLNTIVSDYSKIGNELEWDFDQYDKVVEEIDTVCDKLNVIISSYSSFHYSDIPSDIVDIFVNHVNKYNYFLEHFSSVKEEKSDVKSLIEEIEKKVHGMLDKINPIYVMDETYHFSSLSSINSAMMNIEIVDVSLNKLKMYKKEEDLLLESIEENFNNIKYFYDTFNSDVIMDLIIILLNNLKKFNQFHEKQIFYIENCKNKYIESDNIIKKNFESLGDISDK